MWNISLIGISIACFSIVFVLSKKDKQSSDYLLILWLFFLTLPFVDILYRQLAPYNLIFQKFSNPVITLVHGPCLYLYVNSLILKQKKSLFSYISHFIPIAGVYLLFIFFTPPEMPRPGGGNPGNFDSHNLTHNWFKYLGVFNLFVFFVYSVKTILILIKHNNEVGSYFSQKGNQVNLWWIYLIPIVFFCIVILIVVQELFRPLYSNMLPVFFHALSFLVFTIVLSFFGLKQKPLLYKESSEQTKQVKSLVEPQQIDTIIEEMESYMQKEKPYLNPDFSVNDFADLLGVPRRTLSYVLSTGLSKNFFSYINEYRINEAKLLLKKSDKAKLNILHIAYDVGFNSKSSFNRLFKQYCELTPSQYRGKFLKK